LTLETPRNQKFKLEKNMTERKIYTEKLLTFRGAAEKLNVSFWFLYRRRGELPIVRLGPRTVRLRESDVVAWQNAHVIAAAIVEKTKDARQARTQRERDAGLIPASDLREAAANTDTTA
jgi:excisionase family DNA binding protein